MAEQINDQKTSGRKFSTGSVLLLTLMVGLASGLVAYEIGTIGFANGLGLNPTTLQTNTTNDPATTNAGLRWGRGGFGEQGGLLFRASSQVANVSVTGFNISSQSVPSEERLRNISHVDSFPKQIVGDSVNYSWNEIKKPQQLNLRLESINSRTIDISSSD